MHLLRRRPHPTAADPGDLPTALRDEYRPILWVPGGTEAGREERLLRAAERIGVDHAIADYADEQHGCVATWQLVGLGLGNQWVTRKVTSRWLRRIHHGVYAVGHAALTQDGYRMAAVLAGGAGALLGCRSAGDLLGQRPHNGSKHDIVIPRERAGPRTVRAFRPRRLHPDDVAVVRRIPTTAWARTVIDLAGLGLPRRQIEKAFDRTEQLGLYDHPTLIEAIGRAKHRPGLPLIREILADYDIAPPTKSELEAAMLGIADEASVRRPQVNELVEGLECDFVWHREGLVVEVDGFRTHGTRAGFEADRERDRVLQDAGWRVRRYSWRQVTRHRLVVARSLRIALAQSLVAAPRAA